MVSFKEALLGVAFVFSFYLQLTQSFCIYNELEGDGAIVYAYNIISDERYNSFFLKKIHYLLNYLS